MAKIGTHPPKHNDSPAKPCFCDKVVVALGPQVLTLAEPLFKPSCVHRRLRPIAHLRTQVVSSQQSRRIRGAASGRNLHIPMESSKGRHCWLTLLAVSWGLACTPGTHLCQRNPCRTHSARTSSFSAFSAVQSKPSNLHCTNRKSGSCA